MIYDPSQRVPGQESKGRSVPWRRVRASADDQQASLLFWLTMLALGCVSMLCMTWGAASVLAQKGPEKLLRAEQLLPKLKSIHWQWKTNVFRPSGPTQHAKAPPKDRNTPPHAPPPFAGAAVKVEETPHHGAALPIQACDESTGNLNPCTLQPGESPMMRNWKMLSMVSLLAASATLASPSATLLAQDDAKIEALRKDVEKLTKKVDELVKRPAAELDKSELAKVIRGELKKLEDGPLTDLDTEIKSIKKSVKGVNEDISALRTEQVKQKRQIDELADEIVKLNRKLIASSGSGPATPGSAPAVDKAFMDQLLGYMKKLDDTLAKLGPTETRTSMSPPLKNGSTPTFGRLVFNNLYTDDLLFIVNGKNHRVPAMTKLVLENVPAGPIRYEIAADLFGSLESQAINLAPGQTFTLRAVNRP